MGQLKVPDAPREYATHYRQLLGVDYQSDQTEISPRRSPEMINMISDLGGNPVKRPGYRVVGDAYAGFASVSGDPWSVRKFGVGLRAYKLTINADGSVIEETHRIENSANCGAVKHVFGAGGILYILCEHAWYALNTYDDSLSYIGISEGTMYTLEDESDPKMELQIPEEKFIPIVMTMYKPNGESMVTLPEGTDITGTTEGVNILTPFRRIEYCVQTDTADETVFKIPNVKNMSNAIKVEVLDSSTYNWKTLTKGTDYTIDADYFQTVKPDDPTSIVKSKLSTAKITFVDSKRPYIKVTENDEPHLRFRNAQTVDVPAGVPNVRITYAPWDSTAITVDGTTVDMGFYRKNRLPIYASETTEWFDARLFVAHNNNAYYSRANFPFKIDDNFYFSVDDDIVRLAKTSSSLAVIGEDTGNNTIYLAKGEYDSTLAMPVYSVKTSNAGIGAIAPKVRGVLNDEPLILARSGIYGLSTNYLSEKYTISRSGKINRKLCREANLENAVGIVFNNYFYLAVNGRMYILDGRHRDTSKYGDSSYECYFFNNMPDIKDMYVLNNRMYFVDEYYLYTWNDDLAEHVKYYDKLVIDDEGNPSGVPVKARWASLFDDDGAPQRMKTLMKKGTMALLIPYYHTGCQIYLVKDGDVWTDLGRFDSTITTFEYIDFIEIDFSSNVVSADIFTKKKVKKYKRLQIILDNNEPEPFGLVGVTKTYTFGNYAKR